MRGRWGRPARLLVEARRAGRRRVPGGAPPAELVQELGYRKDFFAEYSMGRLLGTGAFGSVFQVTSRATGDQYAAKILDKIMLGSNLEPGFVERIRGEVDTLNLLAGSLNVAYLYDTCETEVSVVLVFEMLSGGTLWDRIERLSGEGKLTEYEIAKVAVEVLKMLAQCHALGIIYRDVKPENFLFSSVEPDAPLKAIDFGAAVAISPKYPVADRAGTPMYMAPEVVKAGVNLRNPGYSVKVDVYSVGVLIYQLMTGRLPYDGPLGRNINLLLGGEQMLQEQGMDIQDMYTAITQEELDFERPPWDELSSDARDFVMLLLERDHMLRPSANEALEHKFLEQVAQHQAALSEQQPLMHEVVQRLQRYGTYNRLKRIALLKMKEMANLDASEVQELSALFEEIDTNGDGELSVEELTAATQSWKLSLTPAEVEQLMLAVDLNNDGVIQYDEWITALTDWKRMRSDPAWEVWVKEAFTAFGGGEGEASIDMEQLQAIMRSPCISKRMPQSFQDMLRQVDTNKDGRISLAEFELMLASGEIDLALFDSRAA